MQKFTILSRSLPSSVPIMFSDQIFPSPSANAALPTTRNTLIIAAFPTGTSPKTVPYPVKASFAQATAMSALTQDSIPVTSNARKPLPFPFGHAPRLQRRACQRKRLSRDKREMHASKPRWLSASYYCYCQRQFEARRGRRRRTFKVVLGKDVVCDGHRR
jgi:hypothetical protein